MTRAGSIRAYVELARLSNLPTCISNVLVGAAIGAGTGLRTGAGADTGTGTGVPGWWPTIPMIFAIMFLYVAGLALNDVLDLEVDRRERPERPLPSGRLTRDGALRFIWVTSTLGLGIMATVGVAPFVWGLVLAVAIVAYDALHRSGAWSVLLMGACRSMVYLSTAAAFAWPLQWEVAGPLAAGLGAYVAALSVVAAVETRQAPGRRGALALLLPVVAGAPLVCVGTVWLRPDWLRPDRLGPDKWGVTAAAGAVLLVWLIAAAVQLRRHPPRIGLAVGAWIAGISLVDALYLAALDQPILAMVAGGCFALTAAGHRFVRGT